jgi:hypothetical protein
VLDEDDEELLLDEELDEDELLLDEPPEEFPSLTLPPHPVRNSVMMRTVTQTRLNDEFMTTPTKSQRPRC